MSPPEPGVSLDTVAPTAAPVRTVRRRASSLPTRGLRRHLRGIHGVLNLLATLALLYTITLVKALLIPLVLAAFIGLALNPLVAGAARRGLPRWLTSCVLMLALLSGLGTGVALLTQPALNWFHDAPTTIKALAPKLRPLTQQLDAASRATQSLVGANARGTSQARPAAVALTAWDIISSTPRVLAAVLTVVLLVFFFLIYGELLLRRLVEIAPSFGYKRHAVSIVRSIQSEVSRYILTTALINAALGSCTALMLWALKVPDPLLWGSVAALANFIPYVGAITTTILLSLVGLTHFEAVGAALLPALGFACITAVEGNLVTPMILGQRMRISPIAILLWLLLWGWLWGIPGALLAVPMLTSFKLIAERVRGWGWFAHMVQR
ncbi:MAG: AI-2E family transporter [Dyella sp.]